MIRQALQKIFADMRFVLIFLMLVMMAGCSTAPSEAPTASPFLTEKQAIEMAIKFALVGQPELSGSKVAPTNAQAQLMTFLDASKRVSGTDRLAPGEDPNRMVWAVSVDGLWTDEMPKAVTPSPNSPTLEPVRHFTFILDAQTGAQLTAAGHR